MPSRRPRPRPRPGQIIVHHELLKLYGAKQPGTCQGEMCLVATTCRAASTRRIVPVRFLRCFGCDGVLEIDDPEPESLRIDDPEPESPQEKPVAVVPWGGFCEALARLHRLRRRPRPPGGPGNPGKSA